MSGPTFIEGDIIARDFDLGNPTSLDAFLANPDRKWPSGTVEYRFYHTFPTANREIVRRAMDYITNAGKNWPHRELQKREVIKSWEPSITPLLNAHQ